MLDYETQFGKAENQQDITVTVTGTTIKSDLAPADRSEFLMYYSLQMYFANGGGPCYIVSVANYNASLSATTIKAGLTELEKEDEPTIIVFPDATGLSADDAYGLYNDALMQCNKLQDRVTIIDTRMSNLTTVNTTTDFLELRSKISNDPEYIKYGAAYYPYLKTTLDYQYLDADVDVSVTTAADYDGDVTAIDDGDVTNAQSLLAGYVTDIGDFTTEVAGATDPDAVALIPDIDAKVQQIINVSTTVGASLAEMMAIADEAIAQNPGHVGIPALTTAKNNIASWITTNLADLDDDLTDDLTTLNAATDQATVAAALAAITGTLGAPDIAAKVATLQSMQIAALITALGPFSTATTTTTLDAVKLSNNALYNRIKTSITQIPVLLPPSSSIAGVYARVDASSGVWKAPANTSLNYVIGPNYNVSNDLQGGMNIDPLAGKSINAIRSFTGRGTLVWGARTLAGNNNEWKYISVRRFYNMVEESVKKATEGFVFQGNDANTWVQVRAMIENFLILQWKAGALAGAKPEHAFYVRVGLGSTMTADDVLNGRMIVEIGMAVVRPAEFIVLRFSHMMQQS